jgi:exodeoxyribonuclease VII large subunit
LTLAGLRARLQKYCEKQRKLIITVSDSDDMPSFASLRRGAGRRPSRTRDTPADQTPSLFDLLGTPDEAVEQPTEEIVTTADVIAEQSRSLNPEIRIVEAGSQPTKPAVSVSRPEPRVWTVGDLVREVRGLVERSYGQITVDGEISNWRPAGSGHCYFTLKDGNAQLSVVMFRRQASLLRFRPKDGDAVRLRGQVSVYESRGQMQLIAETMEEVGQGALLAAVQRLKERLRREGVFDRERPLPAFPRCIGVVTSLQGAALRDIVKVCRRRHATVNLLIYPAAVQGPRCAEEVIAGVQWFSAHPQHADVLIVARGGGSWEDLHGFDDEGVARAIAACTIPVIAGIGHATDTTIADAAADVCAPTPSAAAELVTAAQYRIEERVERLRSRVLRAGRYEMLRARQHLSRLSAEAALRRLRDALGRREQRLDELGFRAESAATRTLRLRSERLSRLDARLQRQDVALRLAEGKRRLERLHVRLESVGSAMTMRRSQQIERCVSRLETLSPLRVLERGYALVYGPDGKLLRSTASVVPYDNIVARLVDGSVRARVTSKE